MRNLLAAGPTGRLVFCLFVLLTTNGRADEPTANTSAVPTIQVELKIVEVQTGKMKALGFSCSYMTEDGVKQAAFEDFFLESMEKIKSVPQAQGFLQALEQNGLARIVAQPTIATMSGRPTSLAVGSTQLDVVPILLGDGQIRLDCRVEVRPAPNNRLTLDTARELEAGKTYIVGHMQTKLEAGEGGRRDVEVLFLARATVMNSGTQR